MRINPDVGTSLADDFDEDSFAAAAVEFVVEDVFPGAEMQFAVGDGDHDLASHDLSFVVRVGVVFPGSIVEVAARRGIGSRVERDEVLQPTFVVGVKPGLVVVDENAGGDVHGVHQHQTVLHAAL